MNDRSREELSELLRRFVEDSAVAEAEMEIEAGGRLLEMHPAPAPDCRLLGRIKIEMVAAARRRHRRIRVLRGSLAAAAAVVVVAVASLLGPGPSGTPARTYAGMIPHAVWESDNLAAEDLDLVYFNAEIRRIEAQMQGLEAEEGETDSHAVEDLERELMQIETEFWKG